MYEQSVTKKPNEFGFARAGRGAVLGRERLPRPLPCPHRWSDPHGSRHHLRRTHVSLSAWFVMNGDIGRISWPQLWLPAASGIFLALATLSLFAALALGPISLVAPIAGTYPALSMIFALAQGTRPSVMQWFAIAAVIAGAAIVSKSGNTYENSGHIPTGKLKTILALAFCASLGSAVAQTSGQAAVPIFGEVTAMRKRTDMTRA